MVPRLAFSPRSTLLLGGLTLSLSCSSGKTPGPDVNGVDSDSSVPWGEESGGGGSNGDADGDGYTVEDGDCDDHNADVHPHATEVCDGVDNDCNGLTDDDDYYLDRDTQTSWYIDPDGDGYGTDSSIVKSCEGPSGYAAYGGDCDETDVNINPGADEICDGIDNNCDGEADVDPVSGGDWYFKDLDGDGLGAPGEKVLACSGADNTWDCDDGDDTEPQVVDGSGTGTPNGTLKAPWLSIQDGIDHASECVIVLGGHYAEAIDFSGKDLMVEGVEGASSTVIDATGKSLPAVTFAGGESSLAILVGFTVTGGTGNLDETTTSYACGSTTTCTNHYLSYCGGGIYVNSSGPTLKDLLVKENSLAAVSTRVSGNDTYYTYSFGGGLCVVNGSASLLDVEISDNYADQGGAGYLDENAAVDLSRSWVVSNSATDGGGFAVEGGSLSLTNVASVWNDATSDGGGVFVSDGRLIATNVTFGEDEGTGSGVIASTGASVVALTNAIVSGANSGYGVYSDGSGTYNQSYSNVYGNGSGNFSGVTDPTGSSGNLSSDPMFTRVTDNGDATDDDWHLASGSPSIDAGDPSSTYTDADGTTADQGAFGGSDSDWD